MGAYWLDGRTAGYPAIDQVIRGAGLNLRTWDGWQSRSRSSGGFNQLLGIVVHHTASPSTTSFDNDWSYCVVGCPDAPVANMLLGRDGLVGLHAAGASNHAGKGGPYNCSKGTVPLDAGNSYLIGIEAENNGVGEPWQPVMVEAYLRLCGALCGAYGLDPHRDIVAHFEWAPGRKIDPWGGSAPTPGYPFTGPRSWDMGGFRSSIPSSAQAPPNMEDGDIMLFVMVPAGNWWPSNYAPAWMVRYSSGRIGYATSADVSYADSHQIPRQNLNSKQQYNQILADSQSSYPKCP